MVLYLKIDELKPGMRVNLIPSYPDAKPRFYVVTQALIDMWRDLAHFSETKWREVEEDE